MRYAVISDIHSNLEALTAVIRALSRERIDKYLCAGDFVGYGAQPEECIDRTLELDPAGVQGNHDIASANMSGVDLFNKPAREAATWTHEKLGKDYKRFLEKLPLVYKDKNVTMAHGTLHDPQNFNYMFDRHTASLSFALLHTRIGFIGHSHVPGIFVSGNGLPEYFYKSLTDVKKGKKYLVNVGSVGQPRDGDPRASYCIYDTGNASLRIKRISYDVKKAQKKILETGLPPYLAQRLGDGI